MMILMIFQEPEDFSSIKECKRSPSINRKSSGMAECEKDQQEWWEKCRQWDCLSLVMEFSDGKLKQKGIFHTLDEFLS
jgi:hypothetical protein